MTGEVFRTPSSIYDGAFMQKSSTIDDDPKYASGHQTQKANTYNQNQPEKYYSDINIYPLQTCISFI